MILPILFLSAVSLGTGIDYSNNIEIKGFVTNQIYNSNEEMYDFEYTFTFSLMYDNPDTYSLACTRIDCKMNYYDDEGDYVTSDAQYISFASQPLYIDVATSFNIRYIPNNADLDIRIYVNHGIDYSLLFFEGILDANYNLYYNSFDSPIEQLNIEYIMRSFMLDSTYTNAYNDGYASGEQYGISQGYGQGYTDGFNDGSSVDDSTFTIFNGILNIAMVPINFFIGIFNFEVLGINISSLVTALLSVCCVIIVIRLVTGKKEE